MRPQQQRSCLFAADDRGIPFLPVQRSATDDTQPRAPESRRMSGQKYVDASKDVQMGSADRPRCTRLGSD